MGKKKTKKELKDLYGVVDPKDCKHPDFWFSRSLSYCLVHDDMEMETCCVECGISECALAAQKKVVK